MYNAFISYSHEADDKFAPALQIALQKFAKPWYKKRNLEIFRDESSLSASPHLWKNITKALDESEYLILLASPPSEKSDWVNKEVKYWLENKSIETILIALTEGEVEWDKQTHSFINPDNNSLPPVLDDKFTDEPFYIDLRQSKSEMDLSIENPIFKKEILRLAAKLHNKHPNDLASEEVSAFRRMKLVRNTAIISLLLLLVASVIFGVKAKLNGDRANYQAEMARLQARTAKANELSVRARMALANEKDSSLATRLAYEAYLIEKTPEVVITLSDLLDKQPLYYHSQRALPTNQPEDLRFSSKGYCLFNSLLIGQGFNLILSDPEGKQLFDHPIDYEKRLASYEFSRIADQIITTDDNGNITFMDFKGKVLSTVQLPGKRTESTFIYDSIPPKVIVAYPPVNTKFYAPFSNIPDSLKIQIEKKTSNYEYPRIRSISEMKDQTLLISHDQYVIHWNRHGQILDTVFTATDRNISFTEISQDEKYLLIGVCNDVRLINIDERTDTLLYRDEEYNPSRGYSYGESRAIFSPRNDFILIKGNNDKLKLFDISGCFVRNISDGMFSNNSLEFSFDGKLILASGFNGLKMFTLDGKLVSQITHDNVYDYFAQFLPDSYGFRLWNGNWARLYQSVINPVSRNYFSDERMPKATFTPSGDQVLSYSWKSMILWNIIDSTYQKLPVSGTVINTVFINKDPIFLNFLGEGILEKRELNGRIIRKYSWPNELIHSVTISPNGQQILTGSTKGVATVYDLENNVLDHFEAEDYIYSVAFSPDSHYAIAGDRKGVLTLWDRTIKKKKSIEAHNDLISCLAFSHNGQYILTGSNDNKVKLWDRNGNLIQVYEKHGHWIRTVTFSPDDRYILTGDVDGWVKMWDIQGNLLYSVKHNTSVYSAIFNENGSKILVSEEKGINVFSNPMYLLENPDGIMELSFEQKNLYLGEYR